ncbi:phosphoribosylglycinamide formyltransferase [Raoultibacter timonensis]|uniref:Phosphoribosylglycinamide formyltransferase n=1 Tax=Raoultibacter timonensis TaxID=1907662 RepID=A0ABM7WH96_9ACTN|nr:phosphoribosylglycinamide formyltransferase [Raoultibacter timonensis]BDE95614.1 phosphoribosylglycinamide formyltransferase [Raoultibacter timonensis]BDF50218.1 phosphoribosylglycinamide formyltransferase [Raoultibacter timonensis]
MSGGLNREAEPLRIGVLLSGSGTNLAAIIDAIEDGSLNAEIVVVISSRPEAYGLVRAKEHGIATCSLNKELYADPATANEIIATELVRAGAEYVVMAGYMRKLTDEVLQAFPDKVLNLHPALLPSFMGAHAIEEAFDAGVKVTGITVHFANAEYDKGPIIAQRAVEVREDDTLESLEARIHEAEHALYPEVLRWLAAGRVTITEDRKVRISE